MRADHSSNTKMSNLSVPKCLTCEIVIGEKKGYLITLYCSPSQFEHFLLSLENLLGNIRNQDPAFTILLSDFNIRSESWWVHDFINSEGAQIESIGSLYGFSQLIAEPTHILQNSSFYIDLTFTSHQSCNKQQS